MADKIDDTAIRVQLDRYLNGRSTLDEFEDWFSPATWDEAALTPEARELAGEIELRLSEFTSGHWSVAELHDHLYRALGHVVIRTRPSVATTASASSISRWPVRFRPAAGVGTRLSAGFA